MIDLHMHSQYSDGTCTVEEIIAKAKELRLKQIAITDHNILTGSLLGKEISDIDFVVGTELSVGYNGHEVHLLAYFPNGSKTNYKNTQFIINEGETYKKIAILEMVERLNDKGFDISVTELPKYTKGILNRVHICMCLKDHGYINSIQEGFEKYLGERRDCYVERKVVPINEAAEAIHRDGGIAVIAHPYEYEDVGSIDGFLFNIMGIIDGIECFHPSATSRDSKHLVDIATKVHKRITGGSDFHGDNKPDIAIDMMNVDEKYMIKG